MKPNSFKCNTCLIECFYTLKNAKFLYLLFICEFMNKCLDIDKILFMEGDTDSIY
jgi:hypothetical protein